MDPSRHSHLKPFTLSLGEGDISLDIGPLKGAPRGEPAEDIRPVQDTEVSGY